MIGRLESTIRIDGPIRGLDREWNNNLQAGLEKFINDLHERGYFT